jgi:hypothetical protein
LTQLLLASRGRAIVGVQANPWSTVGFRSRRSSSIVRSSIPGVGPTFVEAPALTFFPVSATSTIVSVTPRKGVRFRVTLERAPSATKPAPEPQDPTDTVGSDFIGPIQLGPGDKIKVRGCAERDKVLGPIMPFTFTA